MPSPDTTCHQRPDPTLTERAWNPISAACVFSRRREGKKPPMRDTSTSENEKNHARPAECATDGVSHSLVNRYAQIRAATEALAAPLSAEDQTIQSMPDASPTKWHRAHTSWFFETFLLTPHASGYTPFDERYGYLFNSYYEAAGARHPRAARGMLTRPGVEDVTAYRAYVDEAMSRFIPQCDASLLPLVTLGLHHE